LKANLSKVCSYSVDFATKPTHSRTSGASWRENWRDE
jgi:hypothetical protein